MTRPRLEIADVFRAQGDEYLATRGGTTDQRRVLRAVVNCRTAALGGTHRSLRPLRTYTNRLQFVPQSTLGAELAASSQRLLCGSQGDIKAK